MAACRVAGVDGGARCGSILVPESRPASGGRQLALKVVVLPARDDAARQPDPIFLLTGGPGLGAATEAWTGNLLAKARDTRDVVLVDQRGTGGSAPLTCDIYGEGGLGVYLGERFPAAAVRRCRAELAARADLTQYSTPAAAADLDEVREALAYERVNLFGLSYGAKAALVYLRQYPMRVRSAVLDAVVSTNFPTPLPGAAAGDRALRAVFADCAADPACARTFPSPEADFHSALARLDSGPVPITRRDHFGLKRESALLTRSAFLGGVCELLYSADGAKDIPRFMRRAARGDFTEFAERIADDHRAYWGRFSTGALLSVVCAEDVPFISAADAARAEANSLVGAPLTRELMAACVEWPRAPLRGGYREPVRSETPVLLLSGEFDPITPPEWAAEVARSLPNSRHVVRPRTGHVDVDDCSLSLAAAFFARPDPGALDVACAARMVRRAFSPE